MNIAITGNPYEDGRVTVATRGVVTDAKVAKLNNALKRPTLVANWEKGRPSPIISKPTAPVMDTQSVSRDYDGLLLNIGISATNYANNVNSTGAKKLRVNKIVNAKASNIYNNVKKVEIVPQEEVQKEEVQTLINQINVVPPMQEEVKETKDNEDIRGRHEKSVEAPANTIREVIQSDVLNMPSRMERNASREETVSQPDNLPKPESKAGDMDLYNNLLHNGKEDDVSRQLQGAREELSFEKEESKKLAEQYGKAVRELEELKEDIENKKRIKVQQEKRELTETLNNIETLKRENLERTSDLSSIQAEIARLKAEREAMESSVYNESRSMGRSA